MTSTNVDDFPSAPRRSATVRTTMRLARLIAPLAAAIATTFTATPAHAGTYTVVACGAANGANLSWTASSSTSGLQTGNTCAGGGDSDPVANYDYALYARDLFTNGGGGGTLPAFSSAWWRIDAPLGGRITGLRYTRDLEVDQAPAWKAVTESDDGELEGCQVNSSAAGCSVSGGLGSGLDSGSVFVTMRPQDTQWLRFGVRCTQASCPAGGGSIHDVGAIVYSATVHIEENTLPTVSAPAGAIASGSSFSTGNVGVTATAADNLGIEALEVLVDGQLQDWADYVCDGRLVRPCAAAGTSRSEELTIDVSGLSSGTHTVQIRARDGAGNEAVGPTSSFSVSRATPTPDPTPTPQPQPTPVPQPQPTPVPQPQPQPQPEPVPQPQPQPNPQPQPQPIPQPQPQPRPKGKIYAVKTSTVPGGGARAQGKVTQGCASRVTLRVSGKTPRGKKRSRSGSTKPRRSGSWALRVARPAGVSRKAKLEARITVTPTAICLAPTPVKKAVRR